MMLSKRLANFQNTSLFYIIQTLLAAIIILAVFIYPSNFGPTRLENFALPLFIIVLSFKKLSFDSTMIILLMLNMIIGLIAVYINLNLNNGLMELIRWVKYMLIVVFFSSLSIKEMKIIAIFIRIAFWGMLIVNLLQLFNPLGWGIEITNIYSHHPLYYEGSDSFDRTFRLLGTAINPNTNALLWLLMMLYFLSEYYYERKVQNIIFIFTSFVFIIFTQSRTGIATALFLGFFNLFLYKLNWRNFIFIGSILLTSVFIAIWFKFSYIWQMFLYNPFKIHSLKLRFGIWRDMLNLYYEKPIFGWGNYKNFEILYPKPPDNEYLYVLLNQGAVGFLGIIFIFIYTLFIFRVNRNKYKHSYLPIFVVICFILIGITNLTIVNVRIGLLFFMIWGMAYSYRKSLNSAI